MKTKITANKKIGLETGLLQSRPLKGDILTLAPKLSEPLCTSMDFCADQLREIMNTKLYIGNLPANSTETELKELFTPSGSVVKVDIALDRDTKAQRGFAFVEMSTEAEATAAVAAVNGKNLRGNDIKVNVSIPKAKV